MPHSRQPSSLSASTRHRLNTYALAASAAGVGLFALGQPAGAEIVYTPVHATIGRNGSYNLDLNNDGHIDFRIMEISGKDPFGTYQHLSIRTVQENAVRCRVCFLTSSYGAAALNAGMKIGANTGDSFNSFLTTLPMAEKHESEFSIGSWTNVRGKYLGLKFQLSDGTHFGWARLSVMFQAGSHPTWHALITGYAYETIADKPILAGAINEDGVVTQTVPTSLPHASPFALGTLALGSEGIALWRRENEKVGAIRY